MNKVAHNVEVPRVGALWKSWGTECCVYREHTEIRNNALVTRDALDAFLLQGNSSGMPMDALIQLPTDLPLRET